MSYLNAPATKLLATQCCCCGKALLDAISVSLGIGPDCRDGETGGITTEQQDACNVLTHAAAIAAQRGNLAQVKELAGKIRLLGLTVLADKITERFANAERLAKITIEERDGFLVVGTPYKRAGSMDFKQAWREIPGRKWDGERNLIPVASRPQLWALLQRFFAGVYGIGPKGPFRIPRVKRVKATPPAEETLWNATA